MSLPSSESATSHHPPRHCEARYCSYASPEHPRLPMLLRQRNQSAIENGETELFGRSIQPPARLAQLIPMFPNLLTPRRSSQQASIRCWKPIEHYHSGFPCAVSRSLLSRSISCASPSPSWPDSAATASRIRCYPWLIANGCVKGARVSRVAPSTRCWISCLRSPSTPRNPQAQQGPNLNGDTYCRPTRNPH